MRKKHGPFGRELDTPRVPFQQGGAERPFERFDLLADRLLSDVEVVSGTGEAAPLGDRGITLDQRARWVTLLIRSADEVGLPADAEFRAALTAYLEWGSRIAVENSKPGVHPPPHMPVPRWWWVCDAEPWSRFHASTDEIKDEAPPELPGADVPLSYEAHIRPLFRKRDRDSMTFAFDLWSYDDVSTHAEAILGRLQAGTMPCDGAWPPDRVAAFKRWIEADVPA